MEMFDAKYIDQELGSIGGRIKNPLDIYLIGGCAMSFRGSKETTKDVDIVFKNMADLKSFEEGLFGAQYHQPIITGGEYEKLDAWAMYENKEKFHLDLFVGKVCSKLELSSGMMARAEFYKQYGKMRVFLVSKEDIFLFKGLASEGRKRDLDDMQAIYPNLDWKIILDEAKGQKLSFELSTHLIKRFEEFSKEKNLDVPILAELKKRAKS